jgi:hypothetical protein
MPEPANYTLKTLASKAISEFKLSQKFDASNGTWGVGC